MRVSGWDISGVPILLFSKDELLLCALRRNRSALDVAGTDFYKIMNVATLRTLPGREAFQKVTPNFSQGLRRGSKSNPK